MKVRTQTLALSILSLIALASAVSAQLSGRYTLDPNGSGSRNFTSFISASQALAQQGVSGPVTLTVANGSYQGSWLMPSITGTSSTNKVIIKAESKGGVTILEDPTQKRSIEFVLATQTAPIQWIVFDGFRLPGSIYSLTHAARPYMRHLEIRNCEFPTNARFPSISLNGLDHVVSHNRMHPDRSVVLNGMRHEFHHNVLENCLVTLTGNGTNSQQRAFNNLMYGRPTRSLMVGALGSIVTHNTIVGDPTNEEIVNLVGSSAWPIQFHANIVVNLRSGLRSGAVLRDDSLSTSGVVSDGNLFFKTMNVTPLLRLNNTPFATLQAWQNATGQDLASIVAEPRFVQNLNFRLQGVSPAVDKAVGTPGFVVDDLDDQPRDANPDIGCYELFRPFTVFGKGCPGFFNFIPQMGSSGTAALGSTNFAFTLKDARGGAPAFFSFGASDSSWSGLPLPFRFGGACDLLVSLDLVLLLKASGSGPGNGTAALPILIPNDPAIRGKHLYAQWAIVDPAAVPGLAFSNGGHLTFR